MQLQDLKCKQAKVIENCACTGLFGRDSCFPFKQVRWMRHLPAQSWKHQHHCRHCHAETVLSNPASHPASKFILLMDNSCEPAEIHPVCRIRCWSTVWYECWVVSILSLYQVMKTIYPPPRPLDALALQQQAFEGWQPQNHGFGSEVVDDFGNFGTDLGPL